MKLYAQDVLVGQLHKHEKRWLCSEKLLQRGLINKKLDNVANIGVWTKYIY